MPIKAVASVLGIAAMLAVAGTSPAALAHSSATGVVKERMDAMKDMRDSMKALHAMLNGRESMDRAAAAGHAARIRGHSGEAMTSLFPEGSLHGPSEALPAIWADWPDYEAKAVALENIAAALYIALNDGDDGAAADLFRQTAAACKACHDRYRED